ncbi:MAG: energy transducer TonB [Promethearchaeota archaeon]|jgi:TonB family protein
MNKFMKSIYLLCLIITLCNYAHAEDKIVIESKIFRGLKVQTVQTPIVIISSFSEPYFVSSDPASVEADNKSISHLKSELRNIYQLNQIDHLTTANMIWNGKKRSLRETIQLDDVSYPIYFSPEVLSRNKINLRVEMFKVKGSEEFLDKGMGEKLLDTKMALNFNDPVILGFPSNGETYFLSILITKRKTDDIIKGTTSELRVPPNSLQPPRTIHQVKPVYPQKCKENMIEGSVILEVNTDKKGNIVKLRIVKPVHPDLDNAAKNALKQWKFEPVVNKKGKPVPVAFLVSVNFKLRKQTKVKH